MSWRVVFGLCENDLQRDQEFLRAFAELNHVDLRLTPMRGPVLTDAGARLLARRLSAAAAERVHVTAVLLHADADTVGCSKRRSEAQQWAKRHQLAPPLIVCSPDPCLERWLCRCLGLKGKSAPAVSPCDGWKKSWSKPTGVDLDRVRSGAKVANSKLKGLEDFDLFLDDWDRALSHR